MLTATATPEALALLPELEQEITLTRRVLERAPDASFDWRPHPKSMSLGQLATHTADMLSFLATTLQTEEYDLASGTDDYQPATTSAELLQRLADGAAAAKSALETTTDDGFAQAWVLRHGEQELINQPRREVVRGLISHLVHHRGQLLVYLRLLDVPVPAVYGPSADEAQ